MSEEEANDFGRGLEHDQPAQPARQYPADPIRADLILRKGRSHGIREVRASAGRV